MTGRRKAPITRGGVTYSATGALLLVIFLSGCAGSGSKPILASDSLSGLTEAAYVPAVIATCPVPVGWQAQPLKENSRHTHQVWISPSGLTAYGVVHFKLPLPVSEDLALSGFIAAMRKSEGDAELVEHRPDDRGIAFVADGGRYHMRAQLIVRGWEAWAFYSATLHGKPTIPAELKLADLAVAHTDIRDAEPAIRQARAGDE